MEFNELDSARVRARLGWSNSLDRRDVQTGLLAFHPIIGQIERAAGLAHDDKPRAKLDKLDAVLARTSTTPEDAALFAEMLSLPNDGRYPALDELTAEQRRQRTLAGLMSQLAGLARRQAVLMVFE